MVQNNLTADAILERASELSVPNSVIDVRAKKDERERKRMKQSDREEKEPN